MTLSCADTAPLPADRACAGPSGRPWFIAGPPEATWTLSPAEAAELDLAARRVASEHGADRALDEHDLLVQAEVAIRRAVPGLITRLVDFRLRSSRDGVLLLRGLPVDDPLPLTPRRGAFDGSWRELGRSSVAQLMIMSVLGDVIAYADEKDGRLIQDICPVPGAEERQENTGSALLELHTEDGFHPSKPDFLSLLALRSDHARSAMTVACGIRAVLPQLTPDVVETLRSPWFRIRHSSSFGGVAPSSSGPAPVLSGAWDDPDLCVDFHATEPLVDVAAEALEQLRRRVLGALVGVVLEPGDMMIVDNRKAVHGRTGFSPRYDGQDRWLRRCFAVSDIRAQRLSLLSASRVHQPLSAPALGGGGRD
jgi:L-asparagine oxygenase